MGHCYVVLYDTEQDDEITVLSPKIAQISSPIENCAVNDDIEIVRSPCVIFKVGFT